MPRIGISGHRGFDQTTSDLIDKALHDVLAAYEPTDLDGVTCLADGADALFAQAVLDLGGTLRVIIPAAKYREGFPDEYHPVFDALLARAHSVQRLDFVESDSAAHMAASQVMISEIDELLAVWDGLPARGYGGTADIVAEARTGGVPVRVIWPQGAHRD
jgi:hypothetical protein